MLDISNTAAAMLDGDMLAKITKDDYGSPEYEKVMKTLTYFQDNIELDYIYCIMQVDEREFVFGVDPTVEDPGEFGSPIVYTEALYNASKGKADVDDEPYEDAWGSFYSAYSPVFDSNGNVAGIVAVDFDSEWYHGEVQNLYVIVGSFILFALISSIILAITIASQYKRFFIRLMDKMNNLSGNIDTLIREVDNGFENEDYYSQVQIDRSAISDGMDLLEAKIRVMQLRLKEQIEVIRSHAYVDALTGVNNRNAYTEYLQVLEKKIINNPQLVFSVAVFDINQLKAVNDDLGHDIGDRIIIGIAHDICEVFGEKYVYRVGGDEFVVVLEETQLEDKIKVLKDIINRKSAEVTAKHNAKADVGLSAGYAVYDPDKDRTYSEVFHKADNAMYADKKTFYETHKDRRKRR
ncbi:MAG: diguanylate cyclase [Lachnospiraceae bacterium]|nr:diguanylate cyclase [Lachnospiraceae bacterium]